MDRKINIFTAERPDKTVMSRLEVIADNENVTGIACLPDIYQKEHTKWPSGIVVSTKGIIMPELLEGVGCGVCIFKLETDKGSLDHNMETIAELISTTIKNRTLIEGAASHFKKPDTISSFPDYLKSYGIRNLEQFWRNDTLSRIRFPNMDLRIFKDYVAWPPKDMGHAIIEGNHFIEIQQVEEVYDTVFSKKLGLGRGDILVMIHLESEGLNNEIERKFYDRKGSGEIIFPSSDADEYITLTNISQRYCLMNRIIIAKAISEQLKERKIGTGDISFMLDTTHCGLFKIGNTDDIMIYHHTGAAPALPPGNINLPKEIAMLGQPLILPGALGTESYILKSSYGTPNSLFAVNHGLGRVVSKTYARLTYKEEDIPKTFKYDGIFVKQVSEGGLVPQMNICYKGMDVVLGEMHRYDLATDVAKVRPLLVIK